MKIRPNVPDIGKKGAYEIASFKQWWFTDPIAKTVSSLQFPALIMFEPITKTCGQKIEMNSGLQIFASLT